MEERRNAQGPVDGHPSGSPDNRPQECLQHQGNLVTRREFLRWTGMGLAAASVGGLGLLGGCSYFGGSDSTEPSQTTTSLPASTTVSTEAPTTSTTERSSGAPVRGGTLRVGTIGGVPASIEPNAFLGHMTSNVIFYSLFDTLVKPTSGATTFAWEMSLAESVSMESPTAWTIRLREGATWHNGSPITVDDLIYSFRRALRPDSFASSMLLTIDRDNIETLPAPRGGTPNGIRLNLTAPDSMLIDSLWRIFIVPQGYDPAQPIGSGPFKLQSLAGDRCFLERNDAYWGGAPYADRLAVYAYVEEGNRVSALLGGGLDVAPMIDYAFADQVEADASLSVLSYNSPMTYSLDMNVETQPLADNNIRQALRYAADRPQLVEGVFGGRAQVANDLICPADPNYAADLPRIEYDPDRAKSLMDASGAADTIHLWSPALAPGLRELAFAFVDQANALGFDITPHKMSAGEYFGSRYPRLPMSNSFWLPEPLSVQVALTQLPESRYNPTRFSDEVYASLFRQARAEADSSRRSELFAEMQRIAYERGAWIIPVTPNQVDAYSAQVGGAEPLPLLSYPETAKLWLRG